MSPERASFCFAVQMPIWPVLATGEVQDSPTQERQEVLALQAPLMRKQHMEPVPLVTLNGAYGENVLPRYPVDVSYP